MLTAEQFADAVMSPQAFRWVRWASDWERREADCFGLLVLFFRRVRGVELGPVPQMGIAAGMAAARGWQQCDPEAGSTAWMAFDRDGAPKHCGVLIAGGMLLHSEGDEDRGGSARITRLAAMQRIYPDLRYYRRAPC